MSDIRCQKNLIGGIAIPELPEVETIRRGLEKEVVGRTITSVVGDWPKIVAEPKFDLFLKKVAGKKIKAIKRRGKNLIISLDDGYLLLHFKMTGHMVIAAADKLSGDHWKEEDNSSPLTDRVNQYIHLSFYLDDGRVMALSDLRKFARAYLLDEKRLNEKLSDLGPEPLEKSFTFEVFKKRLEGKRGVIKKVLLEQNVVAGIGNIYADEILFESKISPLRLVPDLNDEELKVIHENIISVLKKAVDLRGTSTSDYRDASGRKGGFTEIRKVYRRTDEPCPNNCGGKIKRVKIGGRSSHYCPSCQK